MRIYYNNIHIVNASGNIFCLGLKEQTEKNVGVKLVLSTLQKSKQFCENE